MQKWFVDRLRRHGAKVVSAANGNRYVDDEKPDFEIKFHGRRHYFDHTFTHNDTMNARYAEKMRLYGAKAGENAVFHPLVFTKECQVHPDSLKILEYIGIYKKEIMAVVGKYIADHYVACFKANA